MNAHGASMHIADSRVRKDPSVPHTSAGYRNLFGDALPAEQYTGFGRDAAGQQKNREMLLWLSQRLAEPFDWQGAGPDNERIPAGYTYLAQLVIHDSVLSLADIPEAPTDDSWRRNDRTSRLMLDTLYGRGPGADRLLYAADPERPADRSFLRLGGRAETGPARDLPRIGCPFAAGQAKADVGATSDALIADSRNEDNVIVGQLTVLFCLLHNIVHAEMVQHCPHLSAAPRFALSRRVVTLIYRKIVFDDLLRRLLMPAVFDYYEGGGAFLDCDDGRMPLEFSHAVARFGHFMVRPEYAINDDTLLPPQERSLRAMMRHTSLGRPEQMPLDASWLVDWSRLFNKPGQSPAIRSQRLGPRMTPILVHGGIVGMPEGGIAYLDFLRGAEDGLRSVASIVRYMPAWIRQISSLLTNGALDPVKIAAQLERTGVNHPLGRRPDFVANILKDMPLLLFVMLEAAATDGGRTLGAIGSAIVAEFYFRERDRTRHLIEDDPGAAAAIGKLFPGGVPDTMPGLIGEIARRRGWDALTPKFW